MLVLVRHGRTEWNREARFIGRSDVALDDVGRDEARRVSAWLGPVAELRTSPLARTRETAALLATGRDAVLDDRFVELDYGELEGTALRDVDAALWRRVRADPTARFPGGESVAELQQRVGRACDELMAHDGSGARRDDGDAVVVTHMGPIKAAVAWAVGAGAELSSRLRLSTGSITTIEWREGAPALLAYNVVPPPLSSTR